MNKLVKIVLGTVVVLLLVFVVGGFFLSRQLPQIVKDAVETYAPKTTGTTVTLGAVDFNFMSGTVLLHHFVVGNPSGYSSDYAFQFDTLKFSLDLSSVFSKVIVIREFSVDGANIIAEQHGEIRHTNLQDIADHAKQVSADNNTTADTDATKTTKDSSSTQPKLIVARLALTNNSVNVVSDVIGSHKLNLPDVVLTDVGKKEGGLTPDQLTQRLTLIITEQISDSVREELRKKIVDRTRDTVRDRIKSWLSR